MPLPTIVIADADGYTADTYIETGSNALQRMIDGGVIRPASGEDIDRIASRERVGYPTSGANWGTGQYVIERADHLYVTQHGFNLGHVEIARRRIAQQQIDAQRADLFARIDGARCPTCGR
jgi:hypothetical protein